MTAAPAAVVDTPPDEPTRPDLVRSVPRFNDISTDPAVVGTNAGLALLTVILVLISGEIFNKTLEENDHEVRAFFRRLAAPFAWLGNLIGGLLGAVGQGSRSIGTIGPMAVLALAALIYAIEEPDFGLNDQSLVLFFSFLGVFVVMTYVYDGAQVLLTRRWGIPSTIRVIPAGVLISVVAVALTKIQGFQPGLVYGFIAADVMLSPVGLTREQHGKKIFYPALVLLAIAGLAYLAADPLRNLAQDNDTWVAAVPEGIAIGLFVTVLQSLFFQMIPIQFMDGHKLMEWNRLAWLAIAGGTGFLFWHVFINEGASSGDAVSATDSMAALGLLVGCVVVTAATYMFFRLRNGHGAMA